MKDKMWKIHIGNKIVKVNTNKESIDAIEAGTRAIEFLHLSKTDYVIGSETLVECNKSKVNIRSDVILANAGRHRECCELRDLIEAHNKNNKKSK